MDKLVKWLENLIRVQKNSRVWRTFISCLAAIVVFTTTYSLILPAITVELSATEDVGGLVLDEADPGSTGAEAEATGEVVSVDAENETSNETVQKDVPDADEETDQTASTGEAPSESNATPSVVSRTETAKASESTAAVAEEVKEPVNGEVQTIGDKRVMTLTGEDFDVVVSGDLSVGVSDGTVLSVRGIPDAEVVKSFSDRISDELLKIFVDTKTTEVLYQLVFTDENLFEYAPTGYFDVQFIFHQNTVSHTGEMIYAAIYDYLTDEMILAEKNGDEYETPVIALDEYGIIKGITLKGMHFDEYSDIITLVAGPVNEELKLAAEKAATGSTSTDSKAGSSTKSAESKPGKTESGKEPSESKTAKTESGSVKTDSAESKSEGPSAKAETSKESEAGKGGALTARGSDYTVTLAYGAEAKIPANAALEVTEIENGTKAYKKYLKQAKAAMGLDEDQELPKEQARFFDIKIMADGKEVQPSANVSVNIAYDQPVVEADSGLDTQIDASAVHFGKKGAEVIEVGVTDASHVEFDAENFSIYGVIYTVDFEYEGYAWSWPGQGSYSIASILAELNVYDEIKSVELSRIVDNGGNYAALYLEENADGWYLTSEEPFSDIFELRVVCATTVYMISVTDAQESSDLTNFLTNIAISGASQNEDGSYTVEQGKDYSVRMWFAESTTYQFDNDADLTYKLPDGITVHNEQSGELTINITSSGVKYPVKAYFTLDTEGNLTVNFDQTDPNYYRLEGSTNVGFNFEYKASFEEEKKYIFRENVVERNIIFKEPEPGQAYAEKSAVFDEATNTYTYTVKVKAVGDVTNVHVSDYLEGEALNYTNNIQIRNSDGTAYTGNYSSVTVPKGFDYTFNSMADGDVITITYTAQLDPNKAKNGKITADQTKNSVNVKPDGGDPHNANWSNEINLKFPDKADGVLSSTDEEGNLIYEWTITYNAKALLAAAGDTVTDTIGTASQSYMKYTGDYISVEVYDPDGTLYQTRTVNYSDLTAHSDSSWTYTIPPSDTTPYKYVIKYKTIVDKESISSLTDNLTLDNTVEDGDGNKDSGKIDIVPKNDTTITKRVKEQTEEYITWESVIHVPEDGLASAVITDTYPWIWKGHFTSENVNVYEKYIENSLTITGRLPGEDYTIDTSDPTRLVITFTNGLKGTPGGHDIVVTLKTEVNPDWLNENYSRPTNNNTKDHINKIDINGKSATATALFSKPGIDKKGPTDSSDVQVVKEYYPVERIIASYYKYEIWLTGISQEEINVTDFFDTSIFELVSEQEASQGNLYMHLTLGGGDYPGQADHGRISVLHSDVDGGVMFTTTTMPKNNDGNYFYNYKITYYVKLKEGVDLDQIAADNGGAYTITNKAFWGDHKTEYSFEHKYNYLTKELLNENAIGSDNRTAQYKITINSRGAMLHEGETIEMTDTLSASLAIDATSIQIVTDPEGVSVPYRIDYATDASGQRTGETVVTYTVPDATKVEITYDALVLGNNSVTITNTAKTPDEESVVTKTKDMGTAGDGSGEVINLKVVKADGYDHNIKLQNVKFKFYRADGEKIGKLEHGEVVEQLDYIEFSTDINGGFTISGDDYELYGGVKYLLEEIEGPDEYRKLDYAYEYTFTYNSADVNHQGPDYIYYFDDSSHIENWPYEGLILKKQVKNGDEVDINRDFKFRVSVLDSDGNVDTTINDKLGDHTFVNGSCEVSLKDGQEVMFWGFKRGTKYKVEEIDGDEFTLADYTVTYTKEKSSDTTEAEPVSGKVVTGEITSEYETVEFTNARPTKFEFSKIWTTSGKSGQDFWHEGKTISVTLKRKLIPDGSTDELADYDPDFSETYILTSDGVDESDTDQHEDYPIVAEPSGNDYKFTISKLESVGTLLVDGIETAGTWKYYISEQQDEAYNPVIYYESGQTTENHGTAVGTGGKIRNDLITVALPHTGGSGTKLFYGFGISFITIAGCFFFIKRRNIRDFSEGRW